MEGGGEDLKSKAAGLREIDGDTPEVAVELDLEIATMRKEIEDEVLATWLWDNELDSLVKECEERDEEDEYEYNESDEEDGERHCGSYGYGYEFRYEDGNPYYAADREEIWENRILGHMQFPKPSAEKSSRFWRVWEGSLHIEGPCHLDPDIISTESLLPRLPKWENRWVGRDRNEPCRRAIQVFSLNLSYPHNVAVEVYGMFAFRDVRNNQLGNYIFEYSRDKPCKLKPGSCKLQPLITPHQGIYAVGLVLIEYRLIIKGQEEVEDKVLIDGYSIYAPSFYGELERLHWHINTGHCGSVDLRMAAIPKAVLATLEFEIYHLGHNLFDSLTVIAIFRNMDKGAFPIFNGKLSVCKLQPITVSVAYDGSLKLDLYTHNSHSNDNNCHPDGVVGDYNTPGLIDYDVEDIMSDTMWFKPQKSGSCTKTSSELYGLEMSVKVTWSSLCEPCQ